MNIAVKAFLRNFVASFDEQLQKWTPDQRVGAVERAAEFLERELPAPQRRRLSEFVGELLAELKRSGKT